MAKKFTLAVELREDAGKGASRRLRRSGKVPGVLYGGGQPPAAIQLDDREIMRNAAEEAFFSSILTLRVGKDEQQGIVKDLQVHPARRAVLHVDLQRVVATEKIRMTVPLHFLNEALAHGVKEGGGIVNHLVTEVQVSCLPKDLPEFIEVDIINLKLNENLQLSEIRLPAGVEIPELAAGQDRPVVSIHVVKEVVEEPLPGEGVAAGEVPATQVSAEGAPVAGEAAKPGAAPAAGAKAPAAGGKAPAKEAAPAKGKDEKKK